MGRARSPELPPDLRRTLRRARRLEWLTVVYMASAVVLLALVLGSSQAMKTAWIEDLLGLIPPVAFLVAARFNTRGPTRRFPYGFHRIVSVAHLCSALALFVMGTYLLVESIIKLVTVEYPTINSIEFFGQTIWLGWLMLPALAYSALPSVFLGRAKIPLAEELHNKVLYADAKMNKANWLTAGAAMVGVVGIGFGLWWADAAAAAIISLDITKDGVSNLRRAVVDLMDQAPTTVDGDDVDPLREELAEMLGDLDWVEDVDLRLREEGQVYFGEALVVPSEETNITEKIEAALKQARDLDWRIYDLALVPVRELPKNGGQVAEEKKSG
jgi:cation diffusion facilitator family transporter